MATDKPLINFVLEPELLKQIDDFRFKNRFATRAEAIRELIRLGLKAAAPK